MGGFRVQGRTESDAARVLADAQAVADAGAFCLVLEGIPSDLAADITAAVQIPTIGIGAGAACDGQVLVCYDLLGMDLRFKPRFVKHYAQLETTMGDAFRAYVDEVRTGVFPAEEHGFSRTANTLKRVY
jgi:3-methyl-2-oxobutanoate hydroxymethyltransferase